MKRGFLLIGLIVSAAVVINGVRSHGSFAVDGSFILWDTYPAKVDGERCTAERSQYHGINSLTQVTVESVTGEPVAAVSLGDGRIASGADLVDLAAAAGQQATLDEVATELAGIPLVPCLFDFRLAIDDAAAGMGTYVVRLGTWGELAYSEANLREPGAVQLSVGLR